MRNIKYKLYYPSYEKVFRITNIAFDKQGLIETVDVPAKDVLPEHYGDTDLMLALYPKHKIELLEFTGQYDVKGKEIYSGDILQFSNGNLGEVIWSDLRAGFDVAFSNAMPEELDHNLANKCKVVGNIYENKELLNE